LLLIVAGLDHMDDQYDFTVHGKEVLPIPGLKKDIKFGDNIEKKLKKGFEIFSGHGRNVLDDRMYVRDVLRKAMQDVSILKECLVYWDKMDDVEISLLMLSMDALGAGTNCPLEQI